MAKVGAKRAAELTGKSKSTIQRAMKNGKLSFEKDMNGRRIIDVSELERVFGLSEETGVESSSTYSGKAEEELRRAGDLLEMERLRIRIKMLEDQVRGNENQIEDLRHQRDQWQKQAQQVLLTSQYSQRQAEEYKAEIRERDRKAEVKRQKILKERMSRLKQQQTPQNKSSGAGAAMQQSQEGRTAESIRQKIDTANESNSALSSGDNENRSFWGAFKKRLSA